MSNNQTHIVHSLKYEVQFEKSENADEHNILSQLHHNQIEKLLQKTFNNISTDGMHIQINNLELDLGVISEKDWQNNFIDQFNTKLNEKLTELISTSQLLAYRDINDSSLKEILYPATILSEEEYNEESILFFFKYGFIKWSKTAKKSVSVNIVFEKNISYNSEFFFQKLITLFLNSDIALRRFITQIEQALQIKFLNNIAPDIEKLFKEIDNNFSDQLINYFKISRTKVDKFSLWLKEKLIRYACAHEMKSRSVEEFIQEYSNEIVDFLSMEIREVNKHELSASFDGPENKLLKLILELIVERNEDIVRLVNNEKKLTSEEGDSTSDFENIFNDAKPDVETESISDHMIKINDKIKGAEIDERIDSREYLSQGLLVPNAGLVLLWPYLTSLFKEFNLLDNYCFKGESELIKALFILHFLATGNIKAEEHELLVPKIITGYSMEWNTPAEIVLEESILKECDKLLKAVIQNWNALKSTSPDGLRQTFLQRNAWIKLQDNEWSFMFERKGVDVLIDQLPYGLSIINLKWLDIPIQVTW